MLANLESFGAFIAWLSPPTKATTSPTSFSFIAFVGALLAAYRLAPQFWRPRLLLAGSYVFYAAAVAEYVVLLLFVTAISFAARRAVGNDRHPTRLAMWASLCLAPLVLFKLGPSF